MYLVCCPDSAITEISKQLASIQILGVPLVLMRIHQNIDNLEWLNKNINNYSYILLNSPTAIQVTAKAIKNVTAIEAFLTVGKASANYLQKLTKKPIIFPEIGSGALALFNEKINHLDLVGKNILILRGGIDISRKRDFNIEAKFSQSKINYTILDIYERVKIEIEAGYFKKLLINQVPQGIILTCGLLVDWLVSYAKTEGCFELLKNLKFITIHPNIAKKLKKAGITRVLITKESKKASIIELIRNLHE